MAALRVLYFVAFGLLVEHIIAVLLLGPHSIDWIRWPTEVMAFVTVTQAYVRNTR